MADLNPNNIATGSFVGIAHDVYCECGFVPSSVKIVADQSNDSTCEWFTAMGTNMVTRVTGGTVVSTLATSTITASTGVAPYYTGLGTIAITSGLRAITGTNTHFLTQLKAGDEILLQGVVYTVNAIASDTACTIDSNYSGTTLTADPVVRVTGRGPGFIVGNGALANNAGDTNYWCAQR